VLGCHANGETPEGPAPFRSRRLRLPVTVRGTRVAGSARKSSVGGRGVSCARVPPPKLKPPPSVGGANLPSRSRTVARMDDGTAGRGLPQFTSCFDYQISTPEATMRRLPSFSDLVSRNFNLELREASEYEVIVGRHAKTGSCNGCGSYKYGSYLSARWNGPVLEGWEMRRSTVRSDAPRTSRHVRSGIGRHTHARTQGKGGNPREPTGPLTCQLDAV
jgi:hypothetical protein